MRNILNGLLFRLFLWLLLSSQINVSGQQAHFIDDVKLPDGWIIQRTIMVPEESLGSFGHRLGSELVSITNYIIDAGGIGLQVNAARCKTNQDAKNVYRFFLSMPNKTEDNCLICESTVFEFLSNDSDIFKIARSVFGQKVPIKQEVKRDAVWEAILFLAPISRADYMSLHEFFNLLLEYRKNPGDTEIELSISQMSNRFHFCDTISLRYEVPPWGSPGYTIDSAEIVEENGDVITFKLKNLKYYLNIPVIEIVAKIPVRAFAHYTPKSPVDEGYLTSATPYWPKHSAKVVGLLKSIIKKDMTVEQKLGAIHDWVFRNIKYRGEIVGTRYGVEQVIEQGFGRCWDKCDVFVTLCRSAGIPARQVMGWINKKAGHTWAQAYLPEKGWVSLDPTTLFKGVSIDYVPFFVSENGELPAIYWSEPNLRMLEN